MLPAISDFLKTTISESFQKALQPAGLVAAAVFVLLNLLFIFPSLVDRGVPFAVAYVALGTVWQAGVMVALTLLMAYLLLSLGNRILAILTGESWRESPLGYWLTQWQDFKRQRLVSRLATAQQISNAKEEAKLSFELATRFPEDPKTRVDRRPEIGADSIMPIMPTALGNVLNAIADDLNIRYRIDLTALWPRMEAAIAGETALMTRINNERSTLDFLVNLTFVLLLFFGENLVWRAYWNEWPQAVASVFVLALAGIVYMAAVGKARSWGDAVQVAFDLHREKLRTMLGMRQEKGRDPQGKDWEAMSRWILFRTVPDDLLVSWQQSEPSPTTITASANIKVTARDVESAERRTPPDGPAERVQIQTMVENLLLLECPGAGQEGQGTDLASPGAYVMVADSRISRILEAPTADPADWGFNAAPTATVVRSIRGSQAQQILWRIGQMPPRGTRVLRYAVPMRTFTAACSAGLTVKERIAETSSGTRDAVNGRTTETITRRYAFTIRNPSGTAVQDATLDVSDERLPSDATLTTATLWKSGSGQPTYPSPTLTDGTRRWPIGTVAPNETFELTYDATWTRPAARGSV